MYSMVGSYSSLLGIVVYFFFSFFVVDFVLFAHNVRVHIFS